MVSDFKHFFEQWGMFADKFGKVIDWFNHFYENISQLSVDLIAYIYEILAKVVLHTPLFIFNNPYLKNTSLTLAIISITLVTILTVYESIMQISKQKHTKFSDILKRYPIAIAVTGFAPFIFENGFKLINKLSDAITMIGAGIERNSLTSLMAPSTPFDVIIMLIFDGMLIGVLIPILLQCGRRYWDLLCLAAISPLAMTAFLFDRHKHHYKNWLNQIKKLSMVQLVYATFIMLMGVFIYGTRFITGDFMTILIPKALIVLGCLYRLANPPQFVKRMTDSGDDIVDVGSGVARTMKNTYDTVTLKKFKPLTMIKKNIANKKSALTALRLKTGKRSVGKLV